jgi:hypothetical protein
MVGNVDGKKNSGTELRYHQSCSLSQKQKKKKAVLQQLGGSAQQMFDNLGEQRRECWHDDEMGWFDILMAAWAWGPSPLLV